MISIIYKPQDLRYIFLTTDNQKELAALEKHLNRIPPHMFLPSYKGIPRPTCFLNKTKNPNKPDQIIYWCNAGLWKEIRDWGSKNGVTINGPDDYFKYNPGLCTKEEFVKYVDSWNLNIDPRYYQPEAAWEILRWRASLSQIATRAGKNLIFYMISRYAMEKMEVKNILMVVPSIQLVKQGVQDLQDYKEFFQTEQIWSKGEFMSTSNLTIGTYQSLIRMADRKHAKYNPKWFDKFDAVCIDEAHHLVADSLNTILALPFLKNIKIKFGFTGTLPENEPIDWFCCQSLMGPKIQDIRTKELIDQGFLAKPDITQIYIKHENNEKLINQYILCGEYLNSNDIGKKKILRPKENRIFTMIYEKKLPYAIEKARGLLEPHEYSQYLIDLCKSKGSSLLTLEHMLVHLSDKHLRVLDQVLENACMKNTIVFGHYKEYLKFLEKHFKEKFPDRPIYLIQGETSLKKREQIKDKLLKDTNAILIASYGTVGTGLTFKNLDYIVFAEGFKSPIINLQSIGRGLIKTDEKDTLYMYDLVDDLPTKKLLSHGKTRQKIYTKEEFDCVISNV